MEGIELVVFDMAGTTVQDRGEVPRAFLEALKKNGIAATAAQVQKRRGASKREVIRFFVERQFGERAQNQERVESAYNDFRTILEGYYAAGGTGAIPGAEQTFSWLRQRGIKVATTTGFYRRVADMIVDSLGWSENVLDARICSDDVAQGRPAPFMIFRAMEATGAADVRRVVKVGDTPLDILAGSCAGVGGRIGVLTGSHGAESLRQADPTHIIASVADLPELLASACT